MKLFNKKNNKKEYQVSDVTSASLRAWGVQNPFEKENSVESSVKEKDAEIKVAVDKNKMNKKKKYQVSDVTSASLRAWGVQNPFEEENTK